MKTLHMVAFLLLVVGGLNWGLFGLFQFNLVNVLVGTMPALENLVYILVGASAVYIMATHKETCTWCMGKKK